MELDWIGSIGQGNVFSQLLIHQAALPHAESNDREQPGIRETIRPRSSLATTETSFEAVADQGQAQGSAIVFTRRVVLYSAAIQDMTGSMQ